MRPPPEVPVATTVDTQSSAEAASTRSSRKATSSGASGAADDPSVRTAPGTFHTPPVVVAAPSVSSWVIPALGARTMNPCSSATASSRLPVSCSAAFDPLPWRFTTRGTSSDPV
jgi:hypothetical protein